MLQVLPVRTASELREFVDFDLEHYRDRPLYAPPIRIDLQRRIRRWTRPREDGAAADKEARLFLARRNGQVVGRLSASIDHVKNEHDGVVSGAFGMLEVVNDPAVSDALFDRAISWLADRNVKRVLGPYGFTQEDPYVGLLVEGFDIDPTFGMTYSQPWYPELVERAGFATAMDLKSYSIESHLTPAVIEERARRTQSRAGIRVRPIDMKRVWDEAKLIRNIFNASLQNNWEFVPLSDEQVRGMVQEIKLLADPRIILFVEVDGKPAGCVINIPCYNDVLRACRGKLFPTGLARLLLARRKRIKMRPYALGVLEPYRRLGLANLLIYETFRRGSAAGYRRGEVTWILGNNTPMNELATQFANPHPKIHRIYEKSLA